ncbi:MULTISPECIES: tryptophan synthase subunit alpha [unclassified Brevundimonas]|uniref:tryptophan synthase subunit alpha n=1 Tax=unclassified Brevundimonas TaxID=2622653 RepID=UPI000CFDF033|nr:MULTISPECIES: tryptophan synthase subunit alpha [unclassified Brevundimonas]PRA23165.1 tryptophan synthase subunit alpha [Brevundimonas sp. MYb27]PQZ74001.1 tryptophan synthase subunit alpha [Brevundimonas sp. MYb31]PRB10663.1 tryptophan synthase subunit alpha [Brevundimonas sp. MYb52]PRB32351.1 tryptophan synthase subunit alpha [Brevundimonas sp. MYb46]PRB41168.1 tryptophan synthase subunit alpha [Brevundimonas sp. MYb33]
MTTARIDARFAALKAEGRAGFIPYVMTGDPSRDEALEILRGLPAAGADLIELGLAFSDPMAEGPPIQRAALRGLAAGMTLRGTLDLVADFRKGDDATPVILMGYLNPVENYGYEAFARDAAAAGVDGLIVVDCPPEEAGPLAAALDAQSVSLIRLATPTSDDDRLKVIARGTSGFVYYVSVAGVTGVKEAQAASVAPAVERVRKAANLPVAVGFGVKTPERAAEIARVADAVVAGSVFVDEVAAALAANEPAVPRVLAKVKALADAVKTARTSASVAETV